MKIFNLHRLPVIHPLDQVNDLLKNCFEHAFQDCEHGHIVISISSNNGFCSIGIGVIDDGNDWTLNYDEIDL